jgi:hypothetical protein
MKYGANDTIQKSILTNRYPIDFFTGCNKLVIFN